MAEKFIKDPWARIKTRNGLNGDEVISTSKIYKKRA